MRYLRAELLRSWLSFRFFMPLIAVLCAVQAASINLGIAAMGGDAGIAALHLYPAFFVIPLSILCPILTEYHDSRLRYGGLLWRPFRRWQVQGTRFVITVVYALVGHVLAVLIVAGGHWRVVLLESVVFAGGYGVGLLLWALVGRGSLVLGPLVGLAWDFCAVYRTESPSWYVNPTSWSLRASLPLFGVHANSVPAEGAAVAGIDPIAPALGHLLLGLTCWLIAVMVYRPRVVVPRGERTRRRSGRGAEWLGAFAGRSRWRALAVPLPWGTWGVLSALMMLILLCVRARYGAENAMALFCLVCVPVGTMIAGLMAWVAHREAWRGLLTRCGGGRLFATLLLEVSVPLLIVDAVGWFCAGAGHSAPYALLVLPGVVGMMLVMTCWGAAESLGIMLAGWLLVFGWSMMAGASVLMDEGWWVSAPWVWAWVADQRPQHWPVIFLASSAVAVGFGYLGCRRMRRRILS